MAKTLLLNFVDILSFDYFFGETNVVKFNEPDHAGGPKLGIRANQERTQHLAG